MPSVDFELSDYQEEIEEELYAINTEVLVAELRKRKTERFEILSQFVGLNRFASEEDVIEQVKIICKNRM